MMCVLQACSFE